MSRFLDKFVASPMPDGRNWCVGVVDEITGLWVPSSRFRYQSNVAGLIECEPGFCTDFTSSPDALWSIIPPWGIYGAIALPHDKGYWEQLLKRDIYDQMHHEGCLLLGVDEKKADAIYAILRAFGNAAWERNAALKESGYTRMAGTGSNPPYAAIPDLPGVTA